MWLADVYVRFLARLDDAAKQLIKRYALGTAVKTAIAPTGLFDTAIVLINSSLLIADLAEIYNLRANRWSTLLILSHALVNTLAAGRMDEATELVGEKSIDALSDLVGSMLAGVTGLIGQRVAEGTANALLMSRLGHYTLKSLRPIALEGPSGGSR